MSLNYKWAEFPTLACNDTPETCVGEIKGHSLCTFLVQWIKERYIWG